MASKSKKKNRGKKLKARKIILSVLVCVLIQAGMLFAFFTFLPEKEPVGSGDLQEFTIIVEGVEVVYGSKHTSSKILVFSDGVCYRFRDRVFGEPGPKDLVKQIQPGDALTILCVEDGTKYQFGKYTADWRIYDAYSDTEVYRDVDKFNKEQGTMRPFLLVVFPIFELGFLFLAGGYFWLFFIRETLQKKQRKKQKEKNKAKKKLGQKM